MTPRCTSCAGTGGSALRRRQFLDGSGSWMQPALLESHPGSGAGEWSVTAPDAIVLASQRRWQSVAPVSQPVSRSLQPLFLSCSCSKRQPNACNGVPTGPLEAAYAHQHHQTQELVRVRPMKGLAWKSSLKGWSRHQQLHQQRCSILSAELMAAWACP